MRLTVLSSTTPRPAGPRAAVATALAIGALAGGATAAQAHTEVASTSPSTGQTASARTRAVTVTFTAQIRSGTLVVRRAGTVVSVGKGGRDRRNVKRLRVGLRAGLKPGVYVARWTAVAADGHRQEGAFSFRLRRR